jgi:hypothetical protein
VDCMTHSTIMGYPPTLSKCRGRLDDC